MIQQVLHSPFLLPAIIAVVLLLIARCCAPKQGRYPTFARDNKHVARGIELGMGHGR